MSLIREALPTKVVFNRYRLTLAPQFEKFASDEFIYHGETGNHITVVEPTQEIQLNALELEVKTAFLEGGHQRRDLSISYNKEQQRVILTSQTIIEPGDHYLRLVFTGTHNDKMAGFYRSRYQNGPGQTDQLDSKNYGFALVTQFEATDARRCFPCADEPALKATFDVELIVPKHLTALSNMPVIKREPVGKECELVRFATTPVMSTYLLAFYVGEVDYLEKTTTLPSGRQVPVRVYTPKGKSEQGQFALELSCQTLTFFSEYFAVEYPLPKMDLIAIPDFSAGAMENWGLVTFRTACLLYQEGVNSFKSKVQIGYIVCHELAHQWFGNLVTMEWWSGLWLNEGFATWVGWMAMDHFYPEWKVWETFLEQEYAHALELDRLQSSHPIFNSVTRATEVGEIFDAITYSKGASIIRMLVNSLGSETFQNGLRTYLEHFQYKNATTEDLWTHLSAASGVNVARMMHSWTHQTGFPLVSVEQSEDGPVTVSQRRFGDVESSAMWVVPLNPIVLEDDNTDIKKNEGQDDTSAKPHASEAGVAPMWLEGLDRLMLRPGVLKLNAGRSGFYLTRYNKTCLDRLAVAIQKGHLSDPVDRAEIISTLCLCAQYDYTTAKDVVDYAENYYKETEYCALQAVVSSLKEIREVWYDHPIVTTTINEVLVRLLEPHYQRLGWSKGPSEESEEESESVRQLRILTINTLISIGLTSDKVEHPCLIEARARFANYLGGDLASLGPDFRSGVFAAMIKHDRDGQVFEKLVEFYGNCDSEVEKNAILMALGSTSVPEVLVKALDFAFNSGQVRSQDALKVSLSASSGELRETNWQWLTQSWATITNLYSGGSFLLGRLVGTAIGGLYQEATLKSATEFLETHNRDLVEIELTLAQSKEKAQLAQKWRQRDMSLLSLDQLPSRSVK